MPYSITHIGWPGPCPEHRGTREAIIESNGQPETGSRALRGGSWINNHNNARVANRNNNHPRNRNNNIGFRVVSLSHIHLRTSIPRHVSRVTAREMRRSSLDGAGWSGPALRRANTQPKRRLDHPSRGAISQPAASTRPAVCRSPPPFGSHAHTARRIANASGVPAAN
ncbi:MAG: hypothetical protein FJW32_21730, partial [Acidobacteria bacterium]|nr:hypothetical protein [Acidobacteriota bacterium]